MPDYKYILPSPRSPCACQPSKPLSAPSTPSPTPPSATRQLSTAVSTKLPSAQQSSGLCPTSPSSERFSAQALATWQTRTSQYRKQRANGRHSFLPVHFHLKTSHTTTLTSLLSRAISHPPPERHRNVRQRQIQQARPRLRRLHLRRLRRATLQSESQV